jgi:thioredoxin 1
MTIEITDANYGETVEKTDKPVIIDFWAEWCGPCRMVGPIVEELAEDYKDQIVVGKIDVDNNPEVTSKFGIRNIPTVIFVKNGEVIDKQVGAVPKSTLEDKLKTIL